jgi:hypothetical protein
MKTVTAFCLGMVLIVALGANYHATGVDSGVYLRPLDPSDGIYKEVYPPQLAFLQQWQNTERTLIFQNLTICKMKLDVQETKTAQMAEYYNKLRSQMDYLIQEFEIDVNDIEVK